MSIPVITIDGPTASGKGTVAAGVARRLGFHYLDSGALYRLTALAAVRDGIALDDERRLAQVALALDIAFAGGKVFLRGEDVTLAVREEATGNNASRIAVLAAVREALLARQRAFRQAPGLVTDGRDMGSVVFPDATLKVFLVASVEKRAARRLKQLKDKGFSANIDTLLQDLRERDARDSSRHHAPLVAAADAVTIDSSDIDAETVIATVVARFEALPG